MIFVFKYQSLINDMVSGRELTSFIYNISNGFQIPSELPGVENPRWYMTNINCRNLGKIVALDAKKSQVQLAPLID